ncbi:hypothetical protein ES288_D13G226700v1 [Gossypium darwinii]|uniref:Uncharacterized protein n=1 Tax=Gossypium darwinii TaxID=34276 RepID=A0A5D2A3I7_GOSDA|nr:hypothetical protein ES288_D13G226700v1 [Gossypium darwinii]
MVLPQQNPLSLSAIFFLLEDTDFQFLQHWIKVCSFWYLVLVVLYYFLYLQKHFQLYN